MGITIHLDLDINVDKKWLSLCESVRGADLRMAASLQTSISIFCIITLKALQTCLLWWDT